MVADTPFVACATLAAALITGTVSDEGTVCAAVRGDDGELYTFRALPEDLTPGTRITLTLTDDELALSCDQGLPSGWAEIVAPAQGDQPERRWTNPDI